MKHVDPPPPPEQQGGPAAEEPSRQGKRPWSKPRLKLIDMDFTGNTFTNANPVDALEDSPTGPSAPFYRSS